MIRAAVPSDAESIAEIHNFYIRETAVTFLPDEKSQADVLAAINGPDPVIVYEEQGVVRGFARYFPFRSGAGYRYTVEHTVLLAPDLKGRGVGRALMSALLDAARAAGKHSVIAVVSGENPDGVAFHQRIGFEVIGVMPQVGYKFGRFMDATMLQYRL